VLRDFSPRTDHRRVGGLEAIVCAKTIETGVVAPTINYETPDPDCDLDYTANTAKKLDKVRVCVSDNLGFGGHNGVIVFERID
jgi:3-oxoacyl-[acyl-carrier-protein] synthase II